MTRTSHYSQGLWLLLFVAYLVCGLAISPSPVQNYTVESVGGSVANLTYVSSQPEL